MSAKDKNGLGYGTQLDEMSNKFETDSEISMIVFEVRSSDEENTPTNDRFSKADGYHAVPPHITGNFLTPRADISFAGLDEYAIRKKIIESKTTELNTNTSKSKTSETVGKTNESKTTDLNAKTSETIDDESEVQTVSPVKTNETQTVETRVDKIGQTSQKQGIGFKKIKACFFCKSTDYLIKYCNFHDKQSQEPKLKTMVNIGPRVDKPLQTFSTARPISTARPVSTARPFAPKIAQTGSAIRPIYPRMDNVRPRASYSPIKRSYYTKPAFRPKNLKQDVKTSRVKNMTTAGTRAVVNTGKGKMDNALKKSRWVWRPKGNYMDHESKEKGSFILKKFEYVDPKGISKSVDHTVVDSGCSSHMTSNKAYLLDYEDYNGGFVAFGSDPKGGKITGKGKIRTANLDFDDVYFVDELKFNLFSVSQMCDKKNSVLFTDTECLIMSPSFKLLDKNQVVLRAPRQNGVYSLDLKNIVPFGGITCLYANATTDESKLWHRRLSHVNFKNINKLVKGHLVRGLPSKVFVNDHTCVEYKKGKQHKAYCKAKLERTIRAPLELLHMDLFGPVSVESINKKKYYLCIVSTASTLLLDMVSLAVMIDVKSAFLYGTIEEEVYVCQPPSFVDPKFPKKVYKVEKALYGRHQAPRAWYETLSTYLLDNGFHRGQIDKTLFIKRLKGDIILVQEYVYGQHSSGLYDPDRRETLNEVTKTSVDARNVSTCLTAGRSDVPVNASRLLPSSEDNLIAIRSVRNHGITDGTVVPFFRIFARFRNMGMDDF
ncbi:putative ribonuclease H-like domain-containing protein [Tanacetum coccineum]